MHETWCGHGARWLLAAATLSLGSLVTDTQLAAQTRPSPLDSVTAEVGGAELAIQYGRPSMRGRVIFGGLVPWDRVWRTGANEATHFRTSADLRLGDTIVPAGEYTLYTVPGEDGWLLIVNRQTGQWGTSYDQEMDLARIPMTVSALDEPVETFTISITAGEGETGILGLEWATTRASVSLQLAEDGGG